MESNSACNHTSLQNRISARRKSDLFIMSWTTQSLVTINHNRYYLRKKQIHLWQTSAVETIFKVKNFSILEIPQFFFQGRWLLLWLLWSILWLVDLAERTQYDWLLQLPDYMCPITANCEITCVRLQPTVRLQLYRMINEK